MRIASLGSGSRGNATLVQHQDTTLLIDNGFSLKQFTQRLQRLEIEPQVIDAVLLTHEHGDHSGGVQRLCASHGIPLWTAVGTARTALEPGFEYNKLVAGEAVKIGGIEVLPVTVPHDASEPLQFIFRQLDNGKRLGVLTDTGHITSHIVAAFDRLDGLLLEFNYDLDMLESGPYPAMLKQRVGGDHGHLSNDQSMDLLRQIDTSSLVCLIAAHISEKNNARHLVDKLIRQLDKVPEPVLADQEAGFGWINV
ncbi:MAG: MBL fold metallo-hydrolase [Gammaproteobacteria bacterium]|nr:MBL fold metallo-hydrolase [Gammaproteobacteria bacterium]MDH3538194.1 MBL fold metallo-hydrolase [Gammaproteobacteria bacterium]